MKKTTKKAASLKKTSSSPSGKKTAKKADKTADKGTKKAVKKDSARQPTKTVKKATVGTSKPQTAAKTPVSKKPVPKKAAASKPTADASPKKRAVSQHGAKSATKKPTEHNISPAELNVYREKLLILRARLRGDVNLMTDAALNKNRMESSGDLSTMPIHMADIGTDNFEQEQTLAFMQSESGMLDMVEEALIRIKEGTYGICESCECRIPKIRLNFLPYAAMCVKCAEIAQRED